VITTLEACIADLRSLLAKSEERAAEERLRCDRLIADTLVANTRAARLESELMALRSRPVPGDWRNATADSDPTGDGGRDRRRKLKVKRARFNPASREPAMALERSDSGSSVLC
jgi:hypothetical protein